MLGLASYASGGMDMKFLVVEKSNSESSDLAHPELWLANWLPGSLSSLNAAPAGQPSLPTLPAWLWDAASFGYLTG